MLGVTNYQPNFLTKAKEIMSKVGINLEDLIGKKILEVWIVWDETNDEWFEDCPVILNIEGTHLEICNWKIDELSLTFDTIDLSEQLNWYDMDHYILKWHDATKSNLMSIKNQRINNIELIEYSYVIENINPKKDNPEQIKKEDQYWFINGIGLILESGYLSIENGLDKNVIRTSPDIKEYLRRINIK